MLDSQQAQKLAQTVLATAEKMGGARRPEVMVKISSGRSANTRFAANEATSNGDVEEVMIHVRMAYGKRHAEASTNQTDPAAIRTVVEHAASLAQIAPEDPEYLPALGPQTYLRVGSGLDPATEAMGAQERAAAAQTAIQAAQAAGVKIAGFYEHNAKALALASSSGLFAYHAGTRADLTMTARTTDGLGSGWAGLFTHRAADLDANALSKRSIDKALRSRAPARLEPGRMTVVLEPAAVGELLMFLLESLHARPADEGRSVFSRPGGGNRLGEQMFGASTRLWSNPNDPELPAAPFDAEGVPLEEHVWINAGRLEKLLYSRSWAAKKGVKPTGQPSSFRLAGGQAESIDALVKGVDRGLLVTRFWYTRMLDPQSLQITGLTRDGVFLIEKGQVTRPVNNFRFNESPVQMLKNLEASTQDTSRVWGRGSGIRVPAVVTHDFNLASISEAI